MTFLRLVNKIVALNSIFGFNKKLSRKDKFNKAMCKLDNTIKTIRYSTSINTINKYFDNMTEEVHKCIKLRPMFKHIYISDYKMDRVIDLCLIEQIRRDYIKAFIIEKADMELKKSESIDNFYIKTKYIKNALSVAIQSVEYLPEDADLRYKILEVEEILNNCYENERGG